jgi:hypothetical protein
MSQTFTLDWREFDKALVEYTAATGKTLADASNRQTLNLAIHGMKKVAIAEKSAIETLESKEFWPKMVASILSKRKAAMLGAMRKKLSRMSTKMSNYGKMQAVTQDIYGISSGTHFYTRDEARAYSKKLINKRLKAVTYLRFFFVSLARAVKPFVQNGKGSVAGKKFNEFETIISPATDKKPTCECTVIYRYKTRKATTAKKADALLQRTMNAVIPETVADMVKETERRMDLDARRYSAK